MVVVDTHCHVSPYWYEPVETLLYQMTTNGVDQAVLIQMSQVRISWNLLPLGTHHGSPRADQC